MCSGQACRLMGVSVYSTPLTVSRLRGGRGRADEDRGRGGLLKQTLSDTLLCVGLRSVMVGIPCWLQLAGRLCRVGWEEAVACCPGNIMLKLGPAPCPSAASAASVLLLKLGPALCCFCCREFCCYVGPCSMFLYRQAFCC